VTILDGIGGSVVPLGVGMIASKTDVWVMQPIILTLFVIIWVSWCFTPLPHQPGSVCDTSRSDLEVSEAT
jgi:hypothetical protein